MSSKPGVLLIGCGFLGGTVLDRLLKAGYPVSVTYRREEQVKVYRDLGVTPVKADLEDASRIEEVTSGFEVLINTASSDHPPSVNASIKGIQRRVNQGKKTIYLHTSGTGVISDQAAGKFKSDIIFEDDKPEMMDGIDDGAPHRAIDKNLVHKAAEWHKAGLAEVRIVLPPLVFGYGSGPFKKHSQQIPTIVTASLDAGSAVCHGPGLAVWNAVNIQDLADGYLTLLNSLVKDGQPAPKSEFDYYVFATGDEFEWKAVSKRIGEILTEKGLIKNAALKEVSDEEAKKAGMLMPAEALGCKLDYHHTGSNSRSRAKKLPALGWQAKESKASDLLASIARDVDIVLKEQEKK